MTPERDKQLCEKYPKIFACRDSKESRQPIAWGIECGDGWYDLIDVLCASIQKEADIASSRRTLEEAKAIQPVVTQVKEKFGGLRFYILGGNDKIYGMISMAESYSYKICEKCGVAGTCRSDGWIRVLCDPCEELRKNRTFQ